jgi:hypothetical protein
MIDTTSQFSGISHSIGTSHVTESSQFIGLDKVRLFIQDYQIKDATRSGFSVQPSIQSLDTGQCNDELLFVDGGGLRVSGAKAFRNESLYQATITSSGLIVQVNPSKPYHPFNLVSDTSVFNDRMNTVFTSLRNNGIMFNQNESKLTRLDVSRNVFLAQPCSSYGQLWPWINQKRSKHIKQYPDGYGTGNDSWGTIFYDKGKESGQYEGNNLLRAEIQFKRSRTIVNSIGVNTYGQLSSYGIEPIQAVYKDYMTNKVLQVSEGANNHTIKFDDEVQVLKKLRADSERSAITRYLQLLGMPYFLETYRTPEIYGQVLLEAGFSRNTVDRQLKQIRKQLELFTALYQDDKNTVGKMLRELHLKLVA